VNDLLNPYIAGAPVAEASMFFGREDVFGWIERSLDGKFVHHILVLHGQRRVGKTSVLKQIPNFLPDKYIQVFFDLQGRTGTTLDRFLWWLASEIIRTLKREHGIDLPKPDRKAFEDTEYLINEFLPGIRSTLGDYVLLLTFDEFDTLDRPEIQETLSRPLIAYLRRLIEVEGLNFIFSIGSSGNKLENMQASYTDFFKSALYRKISFLTSDDTRRLVTKPVEGLIQYEKEAVVRIGEITSGHPYFTQLMCHELFSLCQKTGARFITASDVESVLGDVVERGTVNLKFVWDEASNLEKWILAALAQNGGGNSQELAHALTEQRVRFSEADLNSALIHLRDKDILREDNRFVIHLMRLWLVANRPTDRVREELEEVNPIANRYIEIGDEYRDRGDSRQALEHYQQALSVNPGNLKAQSNIASVYLEQKDYEGAVQAFESALKIDDEDVIARAGYCQASLALGEQARTQKDYENAIRHYQQVLEIDPDHKDARDQLDRIQKIINDYEEAQQAIREKRYEKAVELLQGIIVIDPTYKASTRLLTEAVEGRKVVSPRGMKWLLPGVGTLALVMLGIFFGPQAWNAFLPVLVKEPTSTAEVPISVDNTNVPNIALTESVTDTQNPGMSEPTVAAEIPPAFYEPIFTYIEKEAPTFEDDFSTSKSEWGKNNEGNNVAGTLQDGHLVVTKKEIADLKFPVNGLFNAKDFVLLISTSNDVEGRLIRGMNFVFRSNEAEETYYKASILNDWTLVGVNPAGNQQFRPISDRVKIENGLLDPPIGFNSYLFIVKDQNIAVFVNGEKVIHSDELLLSGEDNYFFGSGDMDTSILIDTVKFWNLDGVEFSTATTPTIMPSAIQTALDTIQNETPAYQTSFDTWEYGDPVDYARVENGKLYLTSTGVRVRFELTKLRSNRLAVEFEFRILESDAEGYCYFDTRNISDERVSRAINAQFQKPGRVTSTRYVPLEDSYSVITYTENVFDPSKTNKATLVILEDQITVFVDGIFVYTAQDPDGSGIYTLQDFTAYFSECEFDNYKIWDLSGVEFNQ